MLNEEKDFIHKLRRQVKISCTDCAVILFVFKAR